MENNIKEKNPYQSYIHIILMIILFFLTNGIGTIIYYLIYSYKYFRSEYFLSIKKGIQKNIDECNELNLHIEELKKSYINFEQIDYGEAKYYDNSNFNYKRPELKNITNSNNIYKRYFYNLTFFFA